MIFLQKKLVAPRLADWNLHKLQCEIGYGIISKMNFLKQYNN